MAGLTRYTCEGALRRLNDFLDRELNADETRLVREHLETCTRCASEYRFEETLLAEIKGKLRHSKLPPDLHAKVHALLKGEGP